MNNSRSLDTKEAEHTKARQKLLSSLNRKPRTISQGKALLVKAGFPTDVVERVLAEAVEQRWLDDEAYAKLWIEDRVNINPRGEALIKRELHAKGVSDDAISSALSESDIDEVKVICDLIEKRRAQYERFDPATRKQKIVGFLRRRGFQFDAIRKAVDSMDL